MQLKFELFKEHKKTKSKKPDLKFKMVAYSTLDINQKINLKSWFFSDSEIKDAFYEFINQSLVLVNINNNQYYTENLKNNGAV